MLYLWVENGGRFIRPFLLLKKTKSEKEIEKMKKTIGIVALLFISSFALVVSTAQTSVGIQTLTADGCKGVVYPTTYGDTIEGLVGPLTTPKWTMLVAHNPELERRLILGPHGAKIVMLYPSRGDTICIPYGMQIGEATAMPPGEFRYEDPSGRELPPKGTIGAPVAKGKPPAVVTLGPSVPSESFLDYFSVGGWILIFALALIVIWGGGALWFVFKPRPEPQIPPTTPEREKDFFDYYLFQQKRLMEEEKKEKEVDTPHIKEHGCYYPLGAQAAIERDVAQVREHQ